MKTPTILPTVLVALLLAACGPEALPSTPCDGGATAPDAGSAADAAPPAADAGERPTFGPSCGAAADCPSARPTCFLGTCVAVVDVPLGCVAPPIPKGTILPPLCDDGDPCTEDYVDGGACFHRAATDGTACVLADYGSLGVVPGACRMGYCCEPADGG